ncbi:hypothetical protein HYALB_00005436 [Hymenoscyphus albidus]|uniref:O-methyltransferase C-terminal domain-containing protein n=1 Tax=Hymenoscyphus albidus TaxID=595503 RepID=A0A9N9LAD8_9HELO|nr:hypothetical protein HYALB_00005436 [Hymenoscyphus albidus]
MENGNAARGFGTLMSTWGEGNSLIQNLYHMNKLANGFDPETPMWVDVGGGYGQKIIALKKAHPDLPGRFIVQDLPGTVQNAPKSDGVEFIAHNFFEEQTVKNARAYYIRQCLHNWPAEKCLTILTELRKAMKPGYSKLFVHELIVPARGASSWVVTQEEFNMMKLCATLERTEEQWKEILAEAGLKVVEVFAAPDGVSKGVIMAEVL